MPKRYSGADYDAARKSTTTTKTKATTDRKILSLPVLAPSTWFTIEREMAFACQARGIRRSNAAAVAAAGFQNLMNRAAPENLSAATILEMEMEDVLAETKIEWANYTMNPWIGCQHVSPGCDNCFAEAMMDKRYGRVTWGPHGERVRTSAAYWRQPLTWAKRARLAQETWQKQPIVGRSRERPARPRVFCASLADVFDNQAPQEWRNDLWRLILDTPELDWLLLTKRPENIFKMVPPCWRYRFPPNVWVGFTAEDQAHFDRRWPIIREIPAAVRFCSYEPAIGPLRFEMNHQIFMEISYALPPRPDLHWLICGGESGPGHRDMPLEWEAEIRRDCARAGVKYFFKQMAGKKPIPGDFPLVRQFPEGAEA